MTTDAAGTGAEKRALRRELLDARRALPPDAIAAGSAMVVDRLRVLPELTGARSVLLYAADPDEVTLDGLLDDPPAGWRVLLPRVEDGAVAVVAHHPGGPLLAGHRGIREPAGDPVDPAEVDVVVVPGVAFTRDGARIGRGAGMYDRLLPRTDGALRIGVCLEVFLRERLPVEAHDAVMDLVVTDASVRRRADTGTDVPT